MPFGASRRAKAMKRNRQGEFVDLPADKKVRAKRSERNQGMPWTAADSKELRQLIRENTPTRVIGLKLGRSVGSVTYHVRKEGLSLKPANRSPYGPRRMSAKAKKAAMRNLASARRARRGERSARTHA